MGSETPRRDPRARWDDLPTARQWLEGYDRWTGWSGPSSAIRGQALWAHYHRAAGDPQRARGARRAGARHAMEPRQPLALLAAIACSAHRHDAGKFNEAEHHSELSISSRMRAPPPMSGQSACSPARPCASPPESARKRERASRKATRSARHSPRHSGTRPRDLSAARLRRDRRDAARLPRRALGAGRWRCCGSSRRA